MQITCSNCHYSWNRWVKSKSFKCPRCTAHLMLLPSGLTEISPIRKNKKTHQ